VSQNRTKGRGCARAQMAEGQFVRLAPWVDSRQSTVVAIDAFLTFLTIFLTCLDPNIARNSGVKFRTPD